MLKVSKFLLLLVLAHSIEAVEPVEIITGEYPPYIGSTLKDNGPTTTLMLMTCERAKLDCKITLAPWGRAYTSVKIGNVAASFFWAKTEERLKEVTFSHSPIAFTIPAVFYRKSRFPQGITFQNWAALKPYSMVGVKNYWYESFYQALNIKVYTVHTSKIAWQTLIANNVDAYTDDFYTGLSEQKLFAPQLTNDLGYTKMTEIGDDAAGYIIFSKEPKYESITKALDQALDTIYQDGTVNKIYNDTLGKI